MNNWGLRSLDYQRWRVIRLCDLAGAPCLAVQQARHAAAVAEARAWRDDQRRTMGLS